MTKRKRPQPIYMGWRKLIDPETRMPRMALVVIDSVGRAQMEERGYRPGDRVRCELSQPRHYGNHKFAHKLGQLARNQLTGFEDCETAHDAVKKLQRDSGVCCDVTATEIPGIGTMNFRQPKSIAFDSMNEEEFRQVFVKGICEHLRDTYWPSLTVEQITEMIDGQEQAA